MRRTSLEEILNDNTGHKLSESTLNLTPRMSMSVAVQIRQHWPGLEGMRHLVILYEDETQLG